MMVATMMRIEDSEDGDDDDDDDEQCDVKDNNSSVCSLNLRNAILSW